MTARVASQGQGAYPPPVQDKNKKPSPCPSATPAPSPSPAQTQADQGGQQHGSYQSGNNGQSNQADKNPSTPNQPYQRPYLSGSGNTQTKKPQLDQNNPTAALDSSAAGKPSASGQVRSVNGKLVDANGNPTVLKGYNVWDPKSATLNDPKLNTVRFNEKDWPGAEHDPQAFMKGVKEFADANPGKTVILGHRPANTSGSANQNRLLSPEQVQAGVDFWKQASTQFKDSPNVVFNLENEIGLKGQDNPEVFSYYQKLIPAARSGGAKNPLLIGDNGFGQGSVTPNTPIQDDFLVNYGAKLRKLDPQDNVIASIHPYNPESYDKLVNLVGDIKKSSGLPVIADEFGDHQNPNTPQWVQKAAKNGVLDGLVFWGGPDLTGAQDVSNFQKNWQPFLQSLPDIGPATASGGKPIVPLTANSGAGAAKTYAQPSATPAPTPAATQPAMPAQQTANNGGYMPVQSPNPTPDNTMQMMGSYTPLMYSGTNMPPMNNVGSGLAPQPTSTFTPSTNMQFGGPPPLMGLGTGMSGMNGGFNASGNGGLQDLLSQLLASISQLLSAFSTQ
jgi:hypothetical protein